ncbi:hypothetical protein BC835DRAFT_1410692 [Cytidiella melzeri]|nr:hypothetical protein BC835DRAFT_1410692 [Cytidiella melzeri]
MATAVHRHMLELLESSRISLADLVVSTLMHPQSKHPHPFLFEDLTRHCLPVLSSLYYNSLSHEQTLSWAHSIMSKHYADAIDSLAHNIDHWHFSASQAKPAQIRDFRLEELAVTIQREQPRLWSLVFRLATGSEDTEPVTGDAIGEDSDAEDEEENNFDHAGPDAEQGLRRKKIHGLRVIKTVTVTSILTHNRFQKCNILQATMGIFLHSCRAPEKLVKVLSRMGVSISLTSIHRAIHSLSRESRLDMQRLGRSLLVSYAYDNFDVKFNTGIPSADGPSDLLVHLTSGTMLKLSHDVKLDDLRVSGSLWDMNPNNPRASNPKHFNPLTTFKMLYSLHPPPPVVHEPGKPRLGRRARFCSWMFVQTLITHGPKYFASMKSFVSQPEAVEMIPLCKTEQVPLRAMDINQSKVSGNIDAIMDMLGQAAVGKHGAEISGLEEINIAQFVQLVHGDLGTMERFVVFVFGLFHFKMAAADAIWRILVTPMDARKDPTGFMAFVSCLRPKSANKLINNAGFREQHELIGHVGSVLRLDVWRVEARKLGYLTLEDWARSEPSLEILRASRINWSLMRQAAQNTMRCHHYLLLYEELSYAMNAGDIGRVEILFQPWIQILKATGKHKYANRMLLFMHQLYSVYPSGLRRAIRYNILVNPTGRPNHFRAVDWIVELLNLYIKEIYGGEGSNYTKKRILEESPLVLIYRQSHANFERNFHLPGLSAAHAQKDMTTAFNEAFLYIKSLDESPNKHMAGRSAKYSTPDVLSRGAAITESEAMKRKHGQESTLYKNNKDAMNVDSSEGDVVWNEIASRERTAVGDDSYWDAVAEVTAADLAADGTL